MSSFSDFRNRNRGSKAAERINEFIKENESKNTYDDGTWSLKMNKETGTAQAVIRFLPPLNGDLPYELYYSHAFKDDDGKWCFVNRCNTTFKDKCPVCEKNSILYNSGIEANKAIVSQRKRRKNYVFNIYVRRDPEHPENEGKVWKFKCGAQIFQMIFDSISPSFDGEEVKRPFDIDSGHDFHIRIRKDASKGGMPTYDKSAFAAEATPLADSEAEIEEIYNQMVDLKEFVNSERQSYEDLQRIADNAYHKIIPVGSSSSSSSSYNNTRQRSSAPAASEPADDLPWNDDVPESGVDDVTGSEDPMEFFKNL